MCTRHITIVLVVFALAAVPTAAQETWFVDADAIGANDCSSWGDACTNPQAALALAQPDDDIWVAEGTYMPDGGWIGDGGVPVLGDGTRPPSFHLGLVDGVALYGGFIGDETELGQRDPEANPTILSGDLAADDDPGTFDNNDENSYHVVRADQSAVLDGFIISAGNANGDDHYALGGGVYSSWGSPSLTNCTFTGNSGRWGGGMANHNSDPVLNDCTFSENSAGTGGGMYNELADPELSNCTFSENSADFGGGGMHNRNSSPTLANCTFRGNTSATAGAGMDNWLNSSPTLTDCTFIENSVLTVLSGWGGGMENWDHSCPTLTNCVFIANTARNGGGGMRVAWGCESLLINCTFSGNTTYGDSGGGGGLYVDAAEEGVTLVNCTFSGNSAADNGGGLFNYQNSTSLKAINCIFSGNRADTNGGGIYNQWNSSSTLINCAFVGNSAHGDGGDDGGGGLYNGFSSDVTTRNCTFSENSADGNGGGMYDVSMSTVRVTNAIVWGNVADADGDSGGPFTDEHAQIYTHGVISLDIDYSCVQEWTGGFGGNGNIPGPPAFVDESTGTWTADGIYDAVTGQTTFTDVAADWDDNELVGRFLNPDDTQVLQFVIVGNTATTITLLGDFASLGAPDITYQIRDYHLDGGSPCIDAADNTAVPADSADLDGDGDLAERTPLDLGGDPRFVNDLDTEDTGVAADDYPEIVDMGAYEVPPARLFVAAGAAGRDVGTSWQNAYHDLQDALDLARQNGSVDEIWVVTGTYKPDRETGSRAATFELVNGVAMFGAFPPGGGDGTFEARNPYDPGLETTLSGELGLSPPLPWDNSYHVVTMDSGGYPVLDGFSIKFGNADGGGQDDNGGGMLNTWGSPRLVNCTFSENSADGNGGGMYNYNDSDPVLTNCAFTGNSASWCGGGIYSDWLADPSLTNCLFSGNSAVSGGGGMYNDLAIPWLSNCTFSGNSAGAVGGGILINDFWSATREQEARHSRVLSNCILWGNSPDQIYVVSSSRVVTYCCVQDEVPGDGNVYPGIGNIDENPEFVRDPDPGPDGTWDGVDDDYGDLRLQAVSPCIDAASDPIVPADGADLDGDGDTDEYTSLDLDGNPRFADDPDTEDTGVADPPDYLEVVDMGVYEFPPPHLFVDASATGRDAGTSWADAYVDLQDALDLAERTGGVVTEIWVAAAMYTPNRGTTDRAATFQLISGVAVYGAFPPGGGDGTFEARDLTDSAYETILSGDLNGDDVGTNGREENSYHVVTGSNVDSNGVLDGFSITAGNADVLSDPNGRGGGMYNYAGNPMLANCTFTGNRSSYTGGAIYNYSSSPAFTGCMFVGNWTGGWGGGMSNENMSSPTLSNCIFSENSAVYDGGGLDNYDGSSPTVTNCIFSENSAGNGGGGLNTDTLSSPELANCTFRGNSAAQGGGMQCVAGSNPSLTNCILWGDSPDEAYVDASDPVVIYSDVQGGWTGLGNDNIDEDPLFTAGFVGCYYLSQTAAGQPGQSPCVDTGSGTAAALGLDTRTTRRDEVGDAGVVDMGYHYPITGIAFARGDFDRDGDVDLTDYANFNECFTGVCEDSPCVPPLYAGPCCSVGDFDDDGDIDLFDFAAFQEAFTGS